MWSLVIHVLPASFFLHSRPHQVNCIAFHPTHGTLATVGSDGRFSFWDKDARTKLKTSDPMEQPISSCAFNYNGNIFAYSVSYDWSKVQCMQWQLLQTIETGPSLPSLPLQGHEHYSPQKKSSIFLRSVQEEMKPRTKKR